MEFLAAVVNGMNGNSSKNSSCHDIEWEGVNFADELCFVNSVFPHSFIRSEDIWNGQFWQAALRHDWNGRWLNDRGTMQEKRHLTIMYHPCQTQRPWAGVCCRLKRLSSSPSKAQSAWEPHWRMSSYERWWRRSDDSLKILGNRNEDVETRIVSTSCLWIRSNYVIWLKGRWRSLSLSYRLQKKERMGGWMNGWMNEWMDDAVKTLFCRRLYL